MAKLDVELLKKPCNHDVCGNILPINREKVATLHASLT